MENQNEQKKGNMFESLRQINTLVSGKELGGVFANIKNAKSNLDFFCKRIKEQIATNEQKTASLLQASKPVTPAQAPASTPIQTQLTQTSAPVTPVKVAEQQPKTDSQPTGQRPQQVPFTPQTSAQNSKPNYAPSQNPTRYNQGQGQNPRFQPRNNNYGDRPNNGYGDRQNNNFGDRPRYQPNNGRFQPSSNNQTYTRPAGQQGQGGFRPRYEGNGPRPFTPRPAGAPRFGAPGATGGYRPNGNVVSYTNRKPRPSTVKFEPIAPQKNTLGGNKAKTKSSDQEKKGLNIKEKIRMGYISFDENENENGVIKIRGRKQKENIQQIKPEVTHVVITEENLTVKSLSEKLGKPASEIVKKLLLLGFMYNINSVIDYQTADLIASDFGITLEKNVAKTYEEKLTDLFKVTEQSDSDLVRRPPVVTVMGHVDHGKTSLLDYIKKSHVVADEAGGITQHIGAYSIKVKDRDITFIDTPGHAAFSDMRHRGATVADIAILIIAADDGVMPQTVEAIKHIKDAKTPMIVAVNKMDKPGANLERIKQQLTEHEVVIEEWGGDTILVPISAHTGEGIEKLLEMILLVSDVNDFKANPTLPASGTCLEAKVDTGRGIVATIIIKDGTLHVGDYIVCGLSGGRVRAMTDYMGKSIKQAGPSMAVGVVGLDFVPSAGDLAYVVDEHMAKNIILERSNKIQIEKTQSTSGVTLENFLSQNAEHLMKTYNIILKADVQGTCEALTQTLESIANEEVTVSVISSGVGVINESDVLLAKTSNAQIIGFNTKLDAKAKQLADKNNLEVKIFKIIYEAQDFVKEQITKMLTPKFKENLVGKAEVRQLFKISSIGIIAGCYILEGYVEKNMTVRVMRADSQVCETVIDTLQQQKNEVKQVKEGFECGIRLRNFNDIKVGDVIVAFESVRI